MHGKYEVSISYSSKVIAKVKVDNRQTDKQTNRQTDRQTDKQTDRQDKKNMPPIIRSGGIKLFQCNHKSKTSVCFNTYIQECVGIFFKTEHLFFCGSQIAMYMITGSKFYLLNGLMEVDKLNFIERQ